jgi:hypothetical protein
VTSAHPTILRTKGPCRLRRLSSSITSYRGQARCRPMCCQLRTSSSSAR